VNWASLFDLSLVPDTALKITLATLLSGLIGLERETHGEAAGFRTYILVGVASCLIMMLSLYVETIYRSVGADSAVRVDPGRIASYTLAGMGFLGAGAIISGRGSVKGLTTAAGMWMITAVGLAVGSGYFIPAIMVTLVAFVSLYILRYTKPLFKRDIYTTLMLVSEDIGGQLNRIEQIFAKYPRSHIQFVSFRRRLDKGVITFRLDLASKEDLEWKDLTRELTELPGIREIAQERGKVP
jgi:putative Mg2+ transporter-C (MgtC) family protein